MRYSRLDPRAGKRRGEWLRWCQKHSLGISKQEYRQDVVGSSKSVFTTKLSAPAALAPPDATGDSSGVEDSSRAIGGEADNREGETALKIAFEKAGKVR